MFVLGEVSEFQPVNKGITFSDARQHVQGLGSGSLPVAAEVTRAQTAPLPLREKGYRRANLQPTWAHSWLKRGA